MRYVISSPCFLGAINEVKPPHLLATIAYKSDIQALEKLTYRPKSIIFDSGAFTVWNSGGKQTLSNVVKEYSRLWNKYKDSGIDINFVSLDVIPNIQGRPPTKEMVRKAGEESWYNYLELRKLFGDKVMPVFHIDDEDELLDKMLALNPPYICLSGNKVAIGDRIKKFFDKSFRKIPKGTKVHVLAGTNNWLMDRYPLFSADSISWKAVALYGRTLTYSNKRKRTAEAVRQIVRRDRDSMVANDLKECMRIQKYYTDLWRARGVSFPEDDE